MRCLGRLACAMLLGFEIAASAGATASAGAWTRAAGEGLVIATAGRRAAPIGSLTGGAASSDANITQIYLEYGALDWLTIGGKAYVELSSTDPDQSSASLGAFVRPRLWRDGRGGVAAVQLGYAHPVESLIGGAFDYADPGAAPEADVALLYGRGWGGLWGSAFLSTGAAYHWRGEGLADELRLEATGGYAPWREWMGMVSLYALVPLAGGTDASLKIAPSIAYTIWPRKVHHWKRPHAPIRPTTIQLGLSFDLLDPGSGVGVMLSTWRRF